MGWINVSIHGNQDILPFLMKKDGSVPPIDENEELALAFYLLTKNLGKNEKVLSFSRLLWPFLSIPGTISTHIILDGLLFFSKRGKYSNPPRQPLIGHILRNIDNRTEVEQLNKIIEILTYKDLEAREIGTDEESEFQELEIKGLIPPEFLDSLLKLLHGITNKPIENYMPLHSDLSTEQAINISEKYCNIIDTMKGNALRWKNQNDLILKTIEKYQTELNVKFSDVKERYGSQIKKTELKIDDNKAEQKEHDEINKIEQWKINEKKKVIEAIIVLFKTVERNLEDILKKNKFYTRDESLKMKVFKDLVPKFESHFDFLKEQGNLFLDSANSLEEKFIEILKKADEIDNQAQKDIESMKLNIKTQLQDRDKQLSEFEKQQKEAMSSIESLRNEIENLRLEIEKILQIKQQQCLKEADELIGWSIQDEKSQFFSIPIKWMHLPLYVIFTEDESMMEEKMNVFFPGYLGDSNTLYEDFSDSFKKLKENLIEKIEDDMKFRSNFEFSSENKNLKNDPNLTKKIIMGISKLRDRNLLESGIENKIRENLNIL